MPLNAGRADARQEARDCFVWAMKEALSSTRRKKKEEEERGKKKSTRADEPEEEVEETRSEEEAWRTVAEQATEQGAA